MANNFELEWYIVEGGAAASNMCTDGTYAWIVNRPASAAYMRLWRMRLSDKQLIKPDGTIGTTADAYVQISSSYTTYNFVVTDGTNLLTLDSNTASAIGIYRNSDMVKIGSVGLSANQIGSTQSAEYYNGVYYIPGWDNNTGRACIYTVDAATWVIGKPYISVIGATTAYILIRNGNNLYIGVGSGGQRYIEKVDLTTWTRAWVTDFGASVSANWMSFDPIRGELWAAPTDSECVRIRDSDGAFLDRTGVPQPYISARITAGGDCLIGSAIGIACVGDQVFTGSYSGSSLQRRSTSVVPLNSGGSVYAAHSNGYLYSLPSQLTPSFVDGTTIYMVMGRRSGTGWMNVGFAWMKLDTLAVTPNIADVSLQAGPTIQVTFDSAVTISGTTIGPPLGKLDIPSVSMSDAMHLQVALSVAPPVLTTVGGNLSDVQLTFDEAITYAGAWTQTPSGASFLLAQPTFDGTNTLLTVPIAAGGAVPRYLTAAKADTTGILLNYDGPILIDGAIDYGTQVNGVRIVSGSQPDANSVHLVAAFANSGTSEWIPTPQSVTGVGVLPYVAAAYAESSTSFVLIFSEEVTESSATNPANYGIVPALDIVSIAKVNGNTYRMVTSSQTSNTTYSVTLTGVVDRANNPI